MSEELKVVIELTLTPDGEKTDINYKTSAEIDGRNLTTFSDEEGEALPDGIKSALHLATNYVDGCTRMLDAVMAVAEKESVGIEEAVVEEASH